MTAQPPELLPITQCDNSLRFEVEQHWPKGLPAVAINRVVIAGFDQELVFNHNLQTENSEPITALINSLYPQLSFTEAASFTERARKFDWIPLNTLLQKWNFRLNDQWETLAKRVLTLPDGFRKWLIEKRVGPQELQILSCANDLTLNALFLSIIEGRLSRSQGAQALETGIELLLIGKSMEEIRKSETEMAEDWLQRLKQLRYPETAKADESSQQKMQNLPWPGQSQVRWVRQGDRAGLELKLFVANPNDLKKSVTSLQKIQDLLDQNPDVLWPEQ